MDPVRLKEFRAALALKHTPHIGPRSWGKLLSAYGGAAPAYDAAARWRMDKAVTVKGIEAFRAGAYKDNARAEFEAATAHPGKLVLWTDPDYPARLRRIPDPPLFLYCLGRRDLLCGPSVAVVGSRSCTGRGLAVASRICTGLAEAGVTVVSGMAWGIDRQAHLAGLSGAGSSIAVLGTGLDRIYPPENADLFDKLCAQGLVVTEFPPGTAPEARNFPYRNRIVSGLSLGVVVVEAALKSGSRITARLGLEQGREVYAVRGPEGSPSFEGCNDLLEQGAQAVGSAGEVILDLAALIKADARAMEAAPRAVAGAPLTDMQKQGPGQGQSPVRDSEPGPGNESTSIHSGHGDAPTAEDAPAADAQIREPESARSAESSPARVQNPEPPLSSDPDQRAVLEALTGADRPHIDELTRALGWDQSRTGRVLAVMEIEGAVRQWPGMRYSLR